MNRKGSIFFLSLSLLVVPAATHAQAWSGIIDPSRAVDWSTAGVVGGIPNRTTICATLSPSGTGTAQINSAIANCPSGQVVFLSAGTYTISGGISFNNHSNVTLRGAGPTQTILQFTGGDNCGGQGGDVCVINGTIYWEGSPATQPGGSNAANWTAGYARGTTQITLDNVSNLSVGNTLILDQANDTVDNGQMLVCDVSPICRQETSSPGRIINGVEYNQQQFVKVTAISGSGPYTVTITPGLYGTNWRSSQTPKAWWTGPSITGVGIENMTLDHTGTSTSILSGTYFFNASNCWVSNVKSLDTVRNHVWLYLSSHIQVQNSYFYGTHNATSQSYGVEAFGTSDDLAINNIFQHITTPIIMGPAMGFVGAYNYLTDMYYTTPTGWMIDSIAGGHDAGAMYNLFEGNASTTQYTQDNYHGSTNLETLFRNQFAASYPGITNNTEVISLVALSRYANFVGNVLGTPGYHKVYEDSSVGIAGDPLHSIYLLGYAGTLEQSLSTIPYDPLVHITMLRWGNYDVVTGAPRWDATEVPLGNALPSSHTLPASFFLSSKPSWWGTMPWPAIGPEVTGGTDPTGHVYDIPAKACYKSTPADSTGILRFDGNTCYNSSASPPPAPPTNLTVVVH